MKVLVIRFSSIGDIVLTTPVIRCLKKVKGKGVEVHYVTKKSFAPFLHNNPYINKVHVLSESLPELIAALKAEDFDFVIDLHNNLRSLRVKLALNKPSRSFSKLNVQKWLMTQWKINRLPHQHIVDRYLAAAAPLGVVSDGMGLDYFLPEDACRLHPALPDVFQGPFAAFVIGGKHATKRLPDQKIISICRKLNQPVLLLGGPEDAANGQTIAAGAGPHVFNACGLLSLDQSAFMVKQARVVITHDTGLMHIAAAFSKPIVSVWGNTIPLFGMYPYMPGNQHLVHYAEINNLPCRPCSKIGYEACPLKHFKCMNLIDEDRVASLALCYLKP